MKFHKVASSPNFFQIEEAVAQYWKENNTFERSIETKSEDKPYRFYDGPPFITGLPHYGHILGSVLKDMVTRFWTQKGHRIDRVWWWDCHGIYVEQKVQAKLWLNSNLEIEKFWVENFINECYTYTSEISDQWEWYVDHLGRWVDFKNAYKTMDNDYMESVMWVFKTLYDKNMVYKGKRVSLYSTKLNTPISNYEIALDNSYADISDPAITVKFKLSDVIKKSDFVHTDDWYLCYVQAVIKDQDGAILSLYNEKHGSRQFPWGKVDQWEDTVQALTREIKEELWIDIVVGGSLWWVKRIMSGELCYIELYEATIAQWQPVIQEPHKHTALWYARITESDNELWWNFTVLNNIIDDASEIIRFNDLCIYQQLTQLVSTSQQSPSSQTPLHFLAWTTTPWTIPANLALVVNQDIDYSQIYDITTQEYYILAHNLISKYYKDPQSYILIYTCKGSELVGLSYQPPFQYLQNPLSPASTSPLSKETNQADFKVYAADYVLDTDGTGIVHTAPEFGEDDFQSWKKFGLTQTEVLDLEWKYHPIISDMAWVYYRDANDIVIDKLKSASLLFKKEQIVHSVAMCPRTNVPLIYKTQDSWFIDIQSIKGKLAEHNQDINWVPWHLKDGRFAKSMESAPDWCISRTRYWATPMPVWIPEKALLGQEGAEWSEAGDVKSSVSSLDSSFIKGAPIKVFGSREEIFQLDQLGSKKLTKIIITRHAQATHNVQWNWESGQNTWLTELGLQQVQKLQEKLSGVHIDAIYSSPLQRCIDTISGIAQDNGIEISYSDKLLERQQWNSNPVKQWKTMKRDDVDEWWEWPKDVYGRAKIIYEEILTKHQWQTVVICGHNSVVTMLCKIIKDFDFDQQRWSNMVHNMSLEEYDCIIKYIDTDTNKEFDLHRPFIDKIWGMVDGVKYVRIPEVLDPWLESGSMPYAQVHYPFENKEKFENSFPADYVAEYLGQVRCWFFFMHALGVMLFDSPAFTNVICTWVLAGNDGRKMSKSYGNYPDPKEAMTAYGSDALRMYMANSPIVVGGDMNFMEEGRKEVLRKISLPLWNSYSFFCTYASIDEFEPNTHSLSDMLNYPLDNKLDQWLIARLTQLVSQVHDGFVAYDMVAASTPIYEFMDDLTNWYIRRSRRRFWKSESDSDKTQAYNTLYVTLVELCKVLAPFMPFLSEHIYRDLTGRESVHLDEWTEVE
jgi:isoleucyl-tRNA synthetase/broad specificity phosphatase PhoE